MQASLISADRGKGSERTFIPPKNLDIRKGQNFTFLICLAGQIRLALFQAVSFRYCKAVCCICQHNNCKLTPGPPRPYRLRYLHIFITFNFSRPPRSHHRRLVQFFRLFVSGGAVSFASFCKHVTAPICMCGVCTNTKHHLGFCRLPDTNF